MITWNLIVREKFKSTSSFFLARSHIIPHNVKQINVVKNFVYQWKDAAKNKDA